MNLSERVATEYGQILGTKFWELFLNDIRDRRALASRECETKDDVRKAQGELIAYDWILGRREHPALAERLISKLKGQLEQEVNR